MVFFSPRDEDSAAEDDEEDEEEEEPCQQFASSSRIPEPDRLLLLIGAGTLNTEVVSFSLFTPSFKGAPLWWGLRRPLRFFVHAAFCGTSSPSLKIKNAGS